MSWRELLITPLTQMMLILAAIFLTITLHTIFSFDLFIAVLVFGAIFIALTIFFMRLLNFLFPFQEGRFVIADNPWVFYGWSLWSYLYITNLYFLYQNLLIPPMFRKPFYQLLGAKIGKGIISMNAVITDPAMLVLGENVIIGEGSLIIGHLITSPGRFMMKKVRIENDALIGVRSVILPGVTIGAHAMVKAGSIVYPGTIIAPGELWGGNPAQKIERALEE